jgi:hypothetical protein
VNPCVLAAEKSRSVYLSVKLLQRLATWRGSIS